jgi:MiaB-like tRNA modifying enzyme
VELGKISIESYGCTMNHGEARTAMDSLASMGYDVVPSDRKDEADTLILFTCDVITTTENRMWRRMEEISGSGKRLIVAGCLAAISPDEILRRYPKAMILPSMGIDEVEEGVQHLTGEGSIDPNDPSMKEPGDRIDTIVPISSGCVGNCSYCITKVARGTVRSYPIADIVERIGLGIRSGRREILLTSQDSAAYGHDGTGKDLGHLLRSITGGIDDLYRVRVGMMNPGLALEHLDCILGGMDHPSIFKFLHIPVQSGSNEVLKSMRRGYTVETYMELQRRIRERFPSITISTDLIIGFPGETLQDHRSSLEVLEEISPEILNITRFSSRPGTDAAARKDQVKGWIMKERSREVTSLHSRILAAKMENRLGSHKACLVTEVGKEGTMMARDENYIPIIIEADREVLGEFVDIDTSSTGPTYLIGGRDWSRSVWSTS